MLRSFLERVQPLVKVEEPSLTLCSKCGEPSSSPVCQFCRVKSRVEELRALKAEASPHLESSRQVARGQPVHQTLSESSLNEKSDAPALSASTPMSLRSTLRPWGEVSSVKSSALWEGPPSTVCTPFI
jgi:hypothetical protein